MTVIVDHRTGRLVWAAEGRNQETLGRFFDELGAERATLLTHVSCDGAEWIHAVVREKTPVAVICLNPFHVVMWTMKALDKVRVRTLAAAGGKDKHAMWAVRKNPIDLTTEQRTSLATIAATNKALYRAYLLKEQLREVFRVKGCAGRQLLAGWLSWASHSPDPGIRHPGPHHPPLPGPDLEHPRPGSVERSIRGHQHPSAGIDQARLWIS